MKKSVLYSGLACLNLILLFSCSAGTKNMSPASLNGEWKILQINGKTLAEDSLRSTPFIGFDYAAGRIYGNAGCNRMMGTFHTDSLTPGTLTFGSVATTRMACPDMRVEQSVLETLAQVKSFKEEEVPGAKTAEPKIAFYNAEGKPVMLLQKRQMKEETTARDLIPAPASGIEALNGEWFIVTVNGKPVGKTEKKPFLGFDIKENKIYGNAGCNGIQGTYKQEEQKPSSLVPGPIAATMMMCPDMETEQMILQALNGVKSFEVIAADRAVLYDEKGAAVLGLEKK